MKCLVTGATGFIGRELCPRLTAAGFSVLALSRQGKPLSDGTPTLPFDLSLEDVDAGLFEGVDVVIHLAGIAHRSSSFEQYERVNHRATIRLAQKASAAGASTFIFLSSVKAMGKASGTAPRTEGDCTEPEDGYGLSKWRAEQGLRTLLAQSPMSLLVLRPTLVYGAAAKGNLAMLAQAVRAGLPRPPARGARSMLSLPGLVDLVSLLALHPPRGQHTWIVSDDETYSTRQLFDYMRSALGRPPGRAWLPLWGWRMVALLMDWIRPFPEGFYSRLFGCECYSNNAVRDAVDWTPQPLLEQTIAAQMEVEDAC